MVVIDQDAPYYQQIKYPNGFNAFRTQRRKIMSDKSKATNKSFTISFHTLAAIILMLCVAFGQTALAADGKVFPGSMCQVALGQGSISAGTIQNDSTTGSLVVDCPVVRELVSGSIQEGQVRVYQAQDDYAIMCTLTVGSYNQTSGIEQVRQANSGEGFRTIQFNAMSGSNNRPFYYTCILPPSASSNHNDKSRVIGYRITEE